MTNGQTNFIIGIISLVLLSIMFYSFFQNRTPLTPEQLYHRDYSNCVINAIAYDKDINNCNKIQIQNN